MELPQQSAYVTMQQHQEVLREIADLSQGLKDVQSATKENSETLKGLKISIEGTTVQSPAGPAKVPGLIDMVGGATQEVKGFKWLLGGVGAVLLTSVLFDILKTIGIVHPH